MNLSTQLAYRRLLPALLLVSAWTAEARAVPYKIVDLGTLPGTSSSVATSINNQGQVVGISYNDGDGVYAPLIRANANPGRFLGNGDGARSFLSDGSTMTSIAPTGGLATSINDSGQVVGGAYTSINNSGQYVGSTQSGVQPYFDQTKEDPPAVKIDGSYVAPSSVSGGVSTSLPIIPYAVNDSGTIGGTVYTQEAPYVPWNRELFNGYRPVVYQDGRTSYVGYTPGNGMAGLDARVVGINDRGQVLIQEHWYGAGLTFQVYDLKTGANSRPDPMRSPVMNVATAINDAGQVVGNGFLSDGSTMQKLVDLLPSPGGWSDLNATDINDAGAIVGQGTIDGQFHAFLMTPETVPEPSTVLIWATIAALGVGRLRLARKGR
ncbi:hypothetical protein [Paludisphaera mucosa]|uniref:PEP-CTERM protein-sorting domain-containing protein n=1 Tax=Paludisphaera mucosa TaxID=3030827 RepID=A0ABT6FHZ7_9BACT|nr:hypothetical protein [Paludisphaera mucosa]MDG3007218.1 hypothetical protein [Paludisphaera mucosa]